MEGSYFWHNQHNEFTGKFMLDTKGMHIEGIIEDPNSECPMHTIEGRFARKGDKAVLEFIKSPPTRFGHMQPILYQLYAQKDSGPEQYSLEGEYVGGWAARYPAQALALAIGMDPNLGEVVVVVPQETENSAQIRIVSRKIIPAKANGRRKL